METKDIKVVRLSSLEPDPLQPRQDFDPQDLKRLRESIVSQGILSPLIVEPKGAKYLIIDGERRYRAATAVGLSMVPVQIVEPMTDSVRLIRRFHIQEQHRNWSIFDKARAIQGILNDGEIESKELAGLLGLSPQRVYDMLGLLQLSKKTQELSASKRIKANYLVKLSPILKHVKDKSLRPKLETALIDKCLNGVVSSIQEFTEFNKAVMDGGEAVIKKIIHNPKYTSVQALKDAGISYSTELTAFTNSLKWLESAINKATKKELYRHYSPDAKGVLHRTILKLVEFEKRSDR